MQIALIAYYPKHGKKTTSFFFRLELLTLFALQTPSQPPLEITFLRRWSENDNCGRIFFDFSAYAIIRQATLTES